MKHAREDYNRFQDPWDLIPENEPVFLLRGQDPFAPDLLRDWADALIKAHGDPIMAQIVRDQANAMEQWQRNRTIHIPNLPK